MKLTYRMVLSMLTVGLAVCSHATPQSWMKPKRVIDVPTDVRKALLIASSSSVLSKYGPLAGVLAELLPRDMNELSDDLKDVDWSREVCIWTFDTVVTEVSVNDSTLVIKPRYEEGTGVRFWFFQKALIGRVKRIKFE